MIRTLSRRPRFGGVCFLLKVGFGAGANFSNSSNFLIIVGRTVTRANERGRNLQSA